MIQIAEEVLKIYLTYIHTNFSFLSQFIKSEYTTNLLPETINVKNRINGSESDAVK
jgi:hypothetical protein